MLIDAVHEVRCVEMLFFCELLSFAQILYFILVLQIVSGKAHLDIVLIDVFIFVSNKAVYIVCYLLGMFPMRHTINEF